MSIQSISDYVSFSIQDRDLDWLKSALQAAIELEHSTLPLYLAAMFSLEVQNYTTYNLIRSIVMEEMVHMAIACNILAALGGRPVIKSLAPKSPGCGLPGNAEPDLEVVLAQLSHSQVKNFMRLEMPDFLLPEKYKQEEYPTIGTLYNAIKEAVLHNADEVRDLVHQVSVATAANQVQTIKNAVLQQIGQMQGLVVMVDNSATAEEVSDKLQTIKEAINHNANQVSGGATQSYANQVGDNIGFTTIQFFSDKDKDPVDQILDAINEIVEQGEGSPSDDLVAGPESENEESHYARFAEIFYGHRFQMPEHGQKITAETEPEFFQGAKIPTPVVTNTLAVPSDGYAKILALDPNRETVEAALDKFDTTYTSIMDDLDAMWNGPAAQSWPTFGKAVAAMTELRVLSCFYIMRHQIPENIVQRLEKLYPDEYSFLSKYTHLDRPVYYGPRFFNKNVVAKS